MTPRHLPPISGRFVKGRSGNPLGRPKVKREKELLLLAIKFFDTFTKVYYRQGNNAVKLERIKRYSMRRKCYLPKSYEELKNLPDKKLQFYWDAFYSYPMKGDKAKLRPLWYAIQCELGRCKLPEKYITRLDRYASNPEKYIEHAHKKRYALTVGTILTKNYKGRTYQVTVKNEQEYEYDGEIYPNLTAVAERIVRAHVSGPKFFGLR